MNRVTRREQIILAAATLVASLAVIVAAKASKPAAAPQHAVRFSRSEQVARGKYLVTIGGCHDCHTPWVPQANGKPGPDMSRALSGHPQSVPITMPAKVTSPGFAVAVAPTNTAWSGPWGVSFTANLTPDKLTGIGIWSFDTFKATIRNGRHWGVSRPLLPPMPWFNYRQMTDEDLAAVFAYLRTLQPVRNQVPEPLPPPQ